MPTETVLKTKASYIARADCKRIELTSNSLLTSVAFSLLFSL